MEQKWDETHGNPNIKSRLKEGHRHSDIRQSQNDPIENRETKIRISEQVYLRDGIVDLKQVDENLPGYQCWNGIDPMPLWSIDRRTEKILSYEK